MLALPGPAIADQLPDGVTAYNRQDYTTALRFWRPLAERPNAAAQNNLGFMYAEGCGVPQDDALAAKWYRLAADQGNAPAQSNLGFMYANGQGVPKDDAQAVKWYRLAAEGATPPVRSISALFMATAEACRRTTCWRICGGTSLPLARPSLM